MRDIIAVLVGWITGMVANMLFTMFNLAMYPMPEGVVFGDNQDFSSYQKLAHRSLFHLCLKTHHNLLY